MSRGWWTDRRGIVAAVVALLAIPLAVAWAHAELLRSVPASGAHVAAPPSELRLVLSEAPELPFTTVRLEDAAGTSVALAPVAVAPESGRTIVVAIRGGMTAGVYSVQWQVAGTDGHPIRGRYLFTVAGSARDSGAASGTVHHDPLSLPAGANGFGAESPWYVAIRWLQFLALLSLLGALAFGTVVLRSLRRTNAWSPGLLAAAAHHAALIGLFASGALALVAVLRLGAQSYAMHGPTGVGNVALLRSMLTGTTWGVAWTLQIAGIIVAAAGFARVLRGRGGWSVAWFGGIALATVPALSGHAVAVPRFAAVAVLADTAHVLAAGAWMGGLLMVVAAGLRLASRGVPDERTRTVTELVGAFHPVALAAVSVLTVTGAYAGWLHLDGFRALWQSPYGRTLLLKLAFAAVALGLGAYNARRRRPALTSAETSAPMVSASVETGFRRSATAELLTGVAVLLITAILVATPTTMDAGAMPP